MGRPPLLGLPSREPVARQPWLRLHRGRLPGLGWLREGASSTPARRSGPGACTTTCWTPSITRRSRGGSTRDRVGIFGGSYGGYAALVGATFTPDVFRCAVDYVGPVEPHHAAREHPALLVRRGQAVRQAARQPRAGPRLPLGTVTALTGRRHPHPTADRAGRQRSPGEAGRIRPDRRRPRRAGNRARVPAVRRRGPRVRPAREPDQRSSEPPTASWRSISVAAPKGAT